MVMKSLYESILKSTNSGKNREVTVDYMCKHGCRPEYQGENVYWLYYEGTGMCFCATGDHITYSIDVEKGNSTKTAVKTVKTVSDFELCCKYIEKLYAKISGKESFKGLSAIKKQILNQLDTYKIYG